MLIGIKNLFIAVMDDETLETYSAPFKIDNLHEIGISPTTGVVDYDGDNIVAISITYISEIEVTMTLADIPLHIQAILGGHSIDDGMVIESTDDQPPYVALGYQATKENGSSVFVWYFKGKFMVGNETATTKG
jgi:phi13 family phage major tail protein